MTEFASARPLLGLLQTDCRLFKHYGRTSSPALAAAAANAGAWIHRVGAVNASGAEK